MAEFVLINENLLKILFFVGSFVVIFWSQSPGKVTDLTIGLFLNFALSFRSS